MDPRAYDDYVAGLYDQRHWTGAKEGLSAAISHFNKAVELDPISLVEWERFSLARWMAGQWDEAIRGDEKAK